MRMRSAGAAALLAAAVIVLAGCAGGPGGRPSEIPASPPTVTPTPEQPSAAAAWIDRGRAIAIITWGSSSTACRPAAEGERGDGQSTDGQSIDVTLSVADEKAACTADYAPRASFLAVPEGIDPSSDVVLTVSGDGSDTEIILAGDGSLMGVPGEGTDYAPSAGWYDATGVVLLTWGSSSCPPIVESVEPSSDGATVSFRSEDRACTMDMAPRLTVLDIGARPEGPQVLTLVGDNLDGAVPIAG